MNFNTKKDNLLYAQHKRLLQLLYVVFDFPKMLPYLCRVNRDDNGAGRGRYEAGLELGGAERV